MPGDTSTILTTVPDDKVVHGVFQVLRDWRPNFDREHREEILIKLAKRVRATAERMNANADDIAIYRKRIIRQIFPVLFSNADNDTVFEEKKVELDRLLLSIDWRFVSANMARMPDDFLHTAFEFEWLGVLFFPGFSENLFDQVAAYYQQPKNTVEQTSGVAHKTVLEKIPEHYLVENQAIFDKITSLELATINPKRLCTLFALFLCRSDNLKFTRALYQAVQFSLENAEGKEIFFSLGTLAFRTKLYLPIYLPIDDIDFNERKKFLESFFVHINKIPDYSGRLRNGFFNSNLIEILALSKFKGVDDNALHEKLKALSPGKLSVLLITLFHLADDQWLSLARMLKKTLDESNPGSFSYFFSLHEDYLNDIDEPFFTKVIEPTLGQRKERLFVFVYASSIGEMDIEKNIFLTSPLDARYFYLKQKKENWACLGVSLTKRLPVLNILNGDTFTVRDKITCDQKAGFLAIFSSEQDDLKKVALECLGNQRNSDIIEHFHMHVPTLLETICCEAWRLKGTDIPFIRDFYAPHIIGDRVRQLCAQEKLPQAALSYAPFWTSTRIAWAVFSLGIYPLALAVASLVKTLKSKWAAGYTRVSSVDNVEKNEDIEMTTLPQKTNTPSNKLLPPNPPHLFLQVNDGTTTDSVPGEEIVSLSPTVKTL